jgi:hypothetical protein
MVEVEGPITEFSDIEEGAGEWGEREEKTDGYLDG